VTASPPRRQRRPDPFKTLGIPHTSTPAEVTTAFRTLAKKYHPDKYQEKPERERLAAQKRMAELNEAYKLAREKLSRGGGEDIYGTRQRSRSTPWEGSDVGAYARTARRTESSAARASRLAASRDQAERAAREHETQARIFQRLRMDARKQAQYGDAVAKSKSRLVAKVPSTLAGAGQAVHTNELACRSCRTIQRLPRGWQDRLADTAFFCSSCDQVLLNR
jgi:curved DNA-binding protein CbpA